MSFLTKILGGKSKEGFARSSAVYFVNDLLQKATGFMLIPLYTSYFIPEEYGILSVTAFILALLVILGDLGQSGALVRFKFVAEKSNNYGAYIASAVPFILVVSSLIMLILFGFGPSMFDTMFKDISFYPYGAIISVTFLFSICNQLYLNILRARGEATKYGIHSFSFFILNIGGAIVAIVGFEMGVLGKLWSALLATSIFGTIGLLLVLKGINVPKLFSLEKLKESLNYGLPAVPHLLAAIILNLADRYVIEIYHDMNEVGIYSLAYQLGSIVLFIALAFDKAWGPFYFSNASKEDGLKKINEVAKVYLVFIVLMSFFIITFMDEVFMIVGSSAYENSLFIIPILIAGLMFKAAYFVPIKSILFRNTTKFIPIITGVAALLNLGLNFLMVPSLGGLGAALATAISYVVMFILTIVISRRYTNLTYHAGKVFLTLALCTLSYFGIMYFKVYQDVTDLMLFAIKVTIVALLVLSILKFRIISKKELVKLKSI